MSLFDQINTASNFDENLTKEKHLPIIDVTKISEGKYSVKVDLGGGKHPNEMDHWFQWVELRVNDLFVGRAEFSAGIMDPIATFTLNLSGDKKPEISALARCNKHGLWLSKKSL